MLFNWFLNFFQLVRRILIRIILKDHLEVIIAGVSWHQVKMRVENGLVGDLAIVVQNVHSFDIRVGRLDSPGNLWNPRENFAGKLFIILEDICDMFLRNNQRMSRRPLRNIEKRFNNVILINGITRDFISNNLTKNTIFQNLYLLSVNTTGIITSMWFLPNSKGNIYMV